MPKHWALSPLPKGYFHHGEHVLALLEQHRPQVVVELGTWRGASAIAMARVVRQWGGVVYCVDTWYGRPKEGRPTQPKRIFECAANLVRAKVHASVRLIVAMTSEAATAWSGPAIDFLYIDALHTYDGVTSDLTWWTPSVRTGGIVAGDDYLSPFYPGLTQAWDDFERKSGWTFNRVPTENTNPPGLHLIWGHKP